MAIGLIGGVISAVGAIQGAMVQQATAEYNAEVAQNTASAISAQTYNEITDKRRENRRQLGVIRAAYGQNNLSLAGSPLDVLEDTTVEQEYDVAKIKYQGEVKAQGYRDQAELFKMEAKTAPMEGFIGAATALLGSFSGQAGGSLLQMG